MTNQFEYDLGQGWKLTQFTESSGEETFNFTRHGEHRATLENESVKKLRDIFKKISATDY